MIIPAEEDFLVAAKKLEDAGFSRAPWSYATVDPDLLGTDPIILNIHREESREFGWFDQYSLRFNFPSSVNIAEKVVLLRSHYVHLSPPSATQILAAPHLSLQNFFVNGNLYYPNKVVLLESFSRVILEEKEAGTYNCSGLLSVWAISYVCGLLGVDVDALDNCEDKGVRDWYNKAIRRDQGGLNREINKRTGRVENSSSSSDG